MFTRQTLQDIIVYVGRTEHPESSEHVCGTFTGPVVTDDPVSIVCATAMMGRFIQIQRTSFGRLVLYDVEVYADATFSRELSSLIRNKISMSHKVGQINRLYIQST